MMSHPTRSGFNRLHLHRLCGGLGWPLITNNRTCRCTALTCGQITAVEYQHTATTGCQAPQFWPEIICGPNDARLKDAAWA